MSSESNSDGGWPAGWLIAAVAGVIAAFLARWIGEVGMAAAVLVGIFVFLVFGVLLGMFWTSPAASGGHDDHGHGDHGHGHGHGDNSHAAPAVQPVAVAEPVAAQAPAVVAPPVAETPKAAAPVAVMDAQAAEPAPVRAEAEAKPVALAGPRAGVADKLQTIEGIGPALEKLCHELGVYHFDQIAAWGAGEVAWMDSNLKGFKGRVTRDKWVRQAALIGEIGIPEFLIRAKTNDY